MSALLPDTIRPERWTVQRGGVQDRYLPGWFAFSPDGQEAGYFLTYEEAVAYAVERAEASLRRQRLIDGLARWGIAFREYSRPPSTPSNYEACIYLHQIGLNTRSIASELGIARSTVRGHIRHAKKRGELNASTD